MRRTLLAALVLGTACGGGAGNAPAPQVTPAGRPATERVVTSSGSTMAINTMNIDTDVRLISTGTPAQVFAVLPQVYTELGIPITVNDGASKSVGNSGWRTRRSIGKVPMHRYLDCGSSGTLQNAETYSIHMSVITSVRPNQGGGSIVSTAITAVGRNPVTSSSADVRCATKGDLEIRIRDMVQKRIEAM
jgi:hypothetical protein